MQPRALGEADLVGIWERGLGRPSGQLALALLQEPDIDPATAAGWTVGERDSRLLALRERALGPRLALVATCPACEERVEAALEVGDLRVEGDRPVEAELHLEAAGRRLVARLPTAGDLVAIEQAEDVESARLDLLERCLLDVEGDPPDEHVVAAAAARMAAADPQADLRLALSCPACGADWEEQFDPVSFFWQELDAWALHLVRDVHELASAYGWSEADVLAIPAARRRLYLELAAG